MYEIYLVINLKRNVVGVDFTLQGSVVDIDKRTV
jgi:hypothetical protein